MTLKRIRFGLIGSGWRAEFYIRIAKMLPDYFELISVLIRDVKKGQIFAQKHNVNVVDTIDKLIDANVDYIVVSINSDYTYSMLEQLLEKQIPILCETPPATTTSALNSLWEKAQKNDARIQVAEQYFLQPLYAAWGSAIDQGMIGQVENVNISALHGYHGISIIRKYLNVSFQNCTITGKRYKFHVVDTIGREGLVQNGENKEYDRDRCVLEFENGCVAFFDFSSPVQYHSLIRTRHLNVQGTRGEIDDLTIRYLTKDNRAVMQQLNRLDFGVYNNQEWSHYGLFLGETQLYESPFFSARLNDDELAVASCMQKMGHYVETGEAFYSLQEALQDAYLANEMDTAIHHPDTVIQTHTQSWQYE